MDNLVWNQNQSISSKKIGLFLLVQEFVSY